MANSDGPHKRAPADPPSGMAASTPGDSQLAQRIWRRYGRAPGVVPTAATLVPARRAGGYGIGHLPLLAEVLRRWAPGRVSPPGDWPLLPYTRSPIGAGARSPSSAPALSFPEAPPAQASVQRATPAQTVEEPVPPDRPTVKKIQRQTGEPGRRTNETLTAHPAAPAGQQAAEVQAPRSAPISGSDLGAAILQRHRQGPADRALQRKVTSPGPAPLEGHVLADTRSTARPALTLPTSSEGSRSALSPTGAVPAHTVASGTWPFWSDQASSGRAAVAQPAEQPVGDAPPTNAGRDTVPTATSQGDWGAALVRRHLDTPLSRTVPREVSSPDPPRLGDRVRATVQRSTRGTPNASPPLMAYLSSGTPHARLHIGMPAATAQAPGDEAFTVGNDLHFSAPQADINNSRGGALPGHELTHAVQPRRREGRSPVAPEEAAVTNERVILRQVTAPLPPTAPTRLPFVQAAVPWALSGVGSQLEGGSSPAESLFSGSRPEFSASTPLTLAATVQRAIEPTPVPEAAAAVSAPAALPAAELSTGTPAEAAPSIDVSELADQVYDMLVRRLASERERRGW
jgi:Domain of unknown function (DUF4157)